MHLILFFISVLSTAFWPSRFLSKGFQVTGATGGTQSPDGILPTRWEISEFSKSGAAWDLFVLALQHFQSIDQTDQLSYFQVAGIHGLPYIPWDGVTQRGVNRGYCMHNSVLFPLWHRPYLALFEQMVWTYAQSIAATYPPGQRQKYQAAAVTLRIPYWDWVVHPSLPAVVTTATIFLNRPDGWHETENPLYRYVFHSGTEGNGFPNDTNISRSRYTTRCPDASFNQSDENKATLQMQNNAAWLSSSVYQLLTSPANYTEFSTAWLSGTLNSANNIESIHNAVHIAVGGTGSMYWPEYAAFDPIFWLHHAQVDRLVALWQALNPTDYVVPSINVWGSFYIPPGSTDSAITFLAPFHADSGSTMYTAESVRKIAAFGYTYPELANVTSNSIADLALLRSTINRLYNQKPTTIFQARPFSRFERAVSVADLFSHVTLRTALELQVNNLEIQWTIRIEVDHRAYSASVLLDFFMGMAPTDVTSWSTAANLIGTFGLFSTRNLLDIHHEREILGNAHGEISITHVLAAGIHRGYLSNMTPDEVVPVLKKHLRWKARTRDDREFCLEEVQGLSISVLSRRVRPSTNVSEFPVYGKFVRHPEVTIGKAGGASGGGRRLQGG